MDILLAIKQQELRDGQKQVFEAAGFQVAAVEEGEAVLDTLQAQGPPKAMIFDSSLPGLNTIALVQNIKRNDDLKKIPIVILLDDKANEQSFIDLGVMDLVSKPFDVNFIKNKVADLIKYGPEGQQRKSGNKVLKAALFLVIGGIAIIFLLITAAALTAK